jgi:hypothetical protein
MISCAQCQFYDENRPKQKSGLCTIELPPWIDVAAIPGGKNKANIVEARNGCDLGKPKAEDDEL